MNLPFNCTSVLSPGHSHNDAQFGLDLSIPSVILSYGSRWVSQFLFEGRNDDGLRAKSRFNGKRFQKAFICWEADHIDLFLAPSVMNESIHHRPNRVYLQGQNVKCYIWVEVAIEDQYQTDL